MTTLGQLLQNPLARVSCCSIQYDFHFDSPFSLSLASRWSRGNACDNTYMSVATLIWIHKNIGKVSFADFPYEWFSVRNALWKCLRTSASSALATTSTTTRPSAIWALLLMLCAVPITTANAQDKR